MGSTTDFLFEGRPPQSVTTYGQTVENIPKWMSDYTQGLIARANAAAAEPYIPYGGPRIAGFNEDEQAAFGLTEANIGAYQPYLEAGAAGYGGGLQRAANIRRSADPFLEAGSQQWTDPGVAESYMNPYIGGVLDRQEDLATRTLEESFLPSLQRTFGGAGQYGSRGGTGSMEDIGVQGMRDIQEGLEAQRLEALSGAYGQGADIFGAGQQRQAELARITGALEEAGAQSMFAGAEGLGRMGEGAQRMGLTDAASMAEIGQQQRGMEQGSMDLAYQDFLEQRNLPFERAGFMSDIIRGLPYSRSTQRTDVGPASIYQPSGLSQLAGAYGVYRGLTNAEGGYIEGDYDDVTDYAEGGYAYPKVMAEGGYYYPEQEFGIGGLATAAWQKMYGLGKSAWGGLTRWAQSLRPDPSKSIGVLGGHTLANEGADKENIELQWKQD